MPEVNLIESEAFDVVPTQARCASNVRLIVAGLAAKAEQLWWIYIHFSGR